MLEWDESEVSRAADLGDAFAQAWMAGETGGEMRFHWAEKAGAQRERDGFYKLGYCYRYEVACEKDSERAKENFLAAAELGNVYALVLWAFWLTETVLNGLFGLQELLQMEILPLS
jgi:TPR repeat protein